MYKTKRLHNLLFVIAVLTWLAVIGQFYLIIENRTASIIETVIRFFSFFTVLTNILVALCCTFLLINRNSASHNFFSKQTTITGIAINITIVGLVYNVILRALWKPEGFQWLVNELLHSVVPVLFILYWIFTPGIKNWKSVLPWLLYPLIYLIYIIIRGSVSGFYPYPFVDVTALGYKQTFINSAGILIAFFVVFFIFLAIDKFVKKDLQS